MEFTRVQLVYFINHDWMNKILELCICVGVGKSRGIDVVFCSPKSKIKTKENYEKKK